MALMEIKAIYNPLIALKPGPEALDLALRSGDTVKGEHYAGHIWNAEDRQVPCTWLRVRLNGLIFLEVPVSDELFTLAYESQHSMGVRMTRLPNPYTCEVTRSATPAS